jgi:deoxyxylulose-5-phosphate synthase
LKHLKIRYFGPIDGHNISKLVDAFRRLKKIPGPKLLHIVTVKGKGYSLAEKDQTKWHAPGLFDKVTGEIYKKNIEHRSHQNTRMFLVIQLLNWLNRMKRSLVLHQQCRVDHH